MRTGLAVGLLTGGVICAVTALVGAASDAASIGWCLATPSGVWLSMMGHCPWCYSALALTAASAAIWPQTIRAPIRAPI